MEPRQTPPHYHTKCRNCGQAIIMSPALTDLSRWSPRDADNQMHVCPNYQPRQPDEMPSRNQARNEQ